MTTAPPSRGRGLGSDHANRSGRLSVRRTARPGLRWPRESPLRIRRPALEDGRLPRRVLLRGSRRATLCGPRRRSYITTVVTTPEDVVPLADLGPLGEDEELAEDQFSELLHSFDGDVDDADSLDDSAATELDSGISMADDESWHSDAPEAPLDVGDIVGIVEETEGDGDELGPLDEGPRADVGRARRRRFRATTAKAASRSTSS